MTKKTPTSKKQDSKEENSLIMPNSTVTITLKKAVVSKKYKSALASLAKKISIDGFRKGTVPPKIAEEQLGQAKVIEYVLEELIPEAYQKAIQDSKKTPITRPEFSITSAKLGEDWIIESHFAELPEVSVKKYESYVKDGAKEGVKAIAKAKKDAAEKKKDDKDKTKTPEMTVDQEKEIKLQHIFKELVTKLKPKVPEMLLKQETQHEFEHISGQLKQLNMTVEDYLKRRGMSIEDLSQDLAVSTLGKLQLDLLLGAIAKEKALKIEDKDREDYFATIQDEKVREQLKKDKHHLGHLETNLLKQKVVDHLLSLA